MSNQQHPHRELAWSQVDVFAEAPLQGNMLAIFHDGRELADAEMQALARETNLSETTFILPRSEVEEREQGVRVRIFTTQEELPFAGHPTLGTASWLWLHHPQLQGSPEITLQLNSVSTRVRFAEPGSGAGVVAEMTQHDPVFGIFPDPATVAHAFGLTEADLHADLKPQVVSTGLPFLVVPLRSVGAASRLSVLHKSLATLLAECGAHFSYCIAPVAELDADAQWHARMVFYGSEDPATGSAAGCAISYLLQHGAASADGAVVFRQGLEVHRPSRIHTRASLREGRVCDVRVSGRTIPVASGRFFLP